MKHMFDTDTCISLLDNNVAEFARIKGLEVENWSV